MYAAWLAWAQGRALRIMQVSGVVHSVCIGVSSGVLWVSGLGA